MSDKDDLTIAWWRPTPMEEDVKGLDKVEALRHERWPLGAVPFCGRHDWTGEPGGTHRACTRCGLLVATQSVS